MNHLLLHLPEDLELLEQELKLSFPALNHSQLAPGIMQLTTAVLPEKVCLAYARQLLRNVKAIVAASVKEWIACVRESLPSEAFSLQIVELGRKEPFVVSKKCELIASGIGRIKASSQDKIIVQVLILGEHGYLSIDLLTSGLSLPARSPAGILTIKDDRDAPSRAFKKILEAELRFGVAIKKGDTVVDLGGSPGGWSYVALQRGARVTAVDRSELREDLMSSPSLNFVKGDAFSFRPKVPVDWLLCDVIAFPERSAELIKSWVEKRLCKNMIVTIKFKGEPSLPIVQDLKTFLGKECRTFDIKHLDSNKNEVTVFAEI